MAELPLKPKTVLYYRRRLYGVLMRERTPRGALVLTLQRVNKDGFYVGSPIRVYGTLKGQRARGSNG